MKVKSQAGAVAAFVSAAGSIWIFIVLLVLLPRLGASVTELGDVAKASKAESQPLFWVSTAAVDLIAGVTIAVIALALVDLLRGGALVRIGTVVGIVGALAWLAGALFSLTDGSHLASLYAADPASAAAAYTTTVAPEAAALAVARALSAIWVALVFWSALRRHALPAPLCYLAIVLALVELASVVIAPARLLLVVLSVVWGVWLGITLLRTAPSAAHGGSLEKAVN
ncbi:MAG TPA: hypothetical protein VGU71_07090 [Candidatus Dormibacteraeota bacterium]|nr:hypothetical protein [Candidatus Dormibacteraeota bacterium]